MSLPEEITINEVVLRDGLQLEEKALTIEEKKRVFASLVKAGIKSFEFGSFVHPKRVPQMANSGDFYGEITEDSKGLELIALIPNLKGAEIAHTHGVEQINFVFSASDTHNRQNVQKSTVESLKELKEIKAYSLQNKLKLNVTIATAFGCPFEGDIPANHILSIVNRVKALGINLLTLADTTGMANPKQVLELMTAVRSAIPNQKIGLHFHNTRGMGLANILAGIEAGITTFDTSLGGLGGLGGCPFAPGATGNVCTEDVVHMLHTMGIKTTVNLEQLVAASALLEEVIEHKNVSYLLKAGPSDRKYPVPGRNYND